MSATEWSYAVEPPDDGWIWLPRPDEDTDPATWADEVCEDLYVDRRAREPLARQLRAYVLSSRRRAGDMAAIWVPDPAYGVLASFVTDRVRQDRDLDALAAARRADVDPGLAAPQVDRVQLPAGPAVRDRRVGRVDEGPAGDGMAESVTHLIAPDVVDVEGVPTLVEVVTTWTLLEEGDELAALADDVAAGVTVTRG